MNISNILSIELFEIAGKAFTVGQLSGTLLSWLLLIILYRFLLRRTLTSYLEREQVEVSERRRLRRILLMALLFLAIIISLSALDLDVDINWGEDTGFRLSLFFKAALIIQLARLSDWLISQVFMHSEKALMSNKPVQLVAAETPAKQQRIVQPFVYVLALLFIVTSFGLNITLFRFNNINFEVAKLITGLLILLGGRLLSHGIVRLVLTGYYLRENINPGSQYAVNQLLIYLIFIISFLMALQAIEIQPTVLLGGAAALLVGIGLGLQQTFNDLVCGLLLLFERTVEVGDVVEVDNMVGTIKRIGLRTSLVDTRENITVIVPNSKLVGDKVINWSHNDDKARFFVAVGVAYGSDTALVKKLLLQAVSEHSRVLKKPDPLVRFVDFGESSLDFRVFFWSRDLMPVENIKSDIRFRIDELFREHNISIPFPQRDVWMR